MKFEVRFSPVAVEDLQSAFDYIRHTREAPLNAERWLDGIQQAIERLVENPHAHPPAREAEAFTEDLRQCVYKSHRIVFDVKDRVVRIHRIAHTARKNLEELP